MTDIQKRKTEHIKLALDFKSQGKRELFEDYVLPYRALSELSLSKVDTTTKVCGKKLNQPLIIASMTGGMDQATEINKNLALASEKGKVALGVGSQRLALEKPEMRKTFEVVRKYAPNTVVFANMGAVQLNYGMKIKDYQEAVKMIGADALYLHLNPIQEALQPGGNTNWEGLVSKIGSLIEKIKVPVWVKEVGSGLDVETVKQLVEIGVAGIDTAGTGGTSWTWIEGKRSGNINFTEWFSDFGLSTEMLIPELAMIKKGSTLVASGGIRSPIQGLKARLLGADLYSAAAPFLKAAIVDAENVQKEVEDWERGLKIAMFGIGVKNWEEAGEKTLLCRTKK
jgi:isopentenyl-diphosphate delta-isomerase